MGMEQLRVAQFTNTTIRAGVEEHILTLLRKLDRNCFRLHLACSSALAEKLATDIPSDVELFRVDFRYPFDPAASRQLRRWLRERRIQVVHSHMFQSSLCAAPVARLAGVPAVIETPHVNEQWRRGWKKSFVVDRIVGRLVDAFIAVSRANARYLVEEKRLPRGKVHVVANGIDPSRFLHPSEHTAILSQKLGFASSHRILLMIARLEPQKGHSVLIRAMADIHSKLPSTRLVLLGEGSLREELEQQCCSMGLQAVVRFAGWQANVEDWLSLADVVVLPSLYEGLPLAAIEALAAGRPIVATDVDGTPEVVLDGQTGLTVPPGDSDALAASIVRLLSDPKLARKLGLAGREFVLRNFSASRQAVETGELYLRAWQSRRSVASVPLASCTSNRGLGRTLVP